MLLHRAGERDQFRLGGIEAEPAVAGVDLDQNLVRAAVPGDGLGRWKIIGDDLDLGPARVAEVLASGGATLCFWRSDASGYSANGGVVIEGAASGVMHKATGPLCGCGSGVLHGTLRPAEWKGERWWIVALHGEVVGDKEKMACLRREIIGECV